MSELMHQCWVTDKHPAHVDWNDQSYCPGVPPEVLHMPPRKTKKKPKKVHKP